MNLFLTKAMDATEQGTIIFNYFSVFKDYLTSHFFDWLITAIVTYFTVRSATRHYYNENKIEISKGVMEQGLRALLKLRYDESLPSSSQVIFVEYRGRCWKIHDDNLCKFCERIRKTVTSVGGNPMRVSPYRPLNYGVLGVANQLNLPVLYDFQNGMLYKFDRGSIYQIAISEKDSKYYFQSDNKEYMFLSNKETTRDIMIAIPISISGKQVGGLTFDLAVGSKTLYQKEIETDDADTKALKESNNIKVFEESLRTARSLVRTFFNSKEAKK